MLDIQVRQDQLKHMHQLYTIKQSNRRTKTEELQQAKQTYD